jgi:hypothetical protein
VFLVSFGLVFGFVSFVSDLLASFHWFKTWPSATGSSASLVFAGGLRRLHRHLAVGTCLPRARELQNSTGAWCIRLLHSPSPASSPGGPWCWEAVLGQRVFLTRLSGRLPTLIHPILCCCCCFLFFWAFVLYPSPHVYLYCFGVWVIVTQYTYEITFNGDLSFVVSVLRVKWPASSKVLPPHIFVHSFIFGLCMPSCFYVFSFLL